MKFEKIPIKCPKCKVQLLTHDGHSTIPKTVFCNNCKKFYKFDPNCMEIKQTDAQHRYMSSGTRHF